MWIIILKSILALVSVFTGGAIFYKYIKDNKILVFLAGSVSILSAVYLFNEIKRDIDKLVVEKKVKVKVEQNQEKVLEVKKIESQDEVAVEKKEVKTTSTSKWFFPTEKSVTWEKAKELCSDNGGRLPSLKELENFIINCGGELSNNVLDFNPNKEKPSFKSCYRNQGFSSKRYWSSSTREYFTYAVWTIFIDSGYSSSYGNFGKSDVCCIKE